MKTSIPDDEAVGKTVAGVLQDGPFVAIHFTDDTFLLIEAKKEPYDEDYLEQTVGATGAKLDTQLRENLFRLTHLGICNREETERIRAELTRQR